MGLTQFDETKSLRENYKGEDGNQVISIGAQYSDRLISFAIDMFNPDYCKSNQKEVESIITSFLGKLNALLEESNLPTIKT